MLRTLISRHVQPACIRTTLQAHARASSTVPEASGGVKDASIQSKGSRTLVTNAEGHWPPRVLITGGLGQLGSSLAKELRYVQVLRCSHLVLDVCVYAAQYTRCIIYFYSL